MNYAQFAPWNGPDVFWTQAEEKLSGLTFSEQIGMPQANSVPPINTAALLGGGEDKCLELSM